MTQNTTTNNYLPSDYQTFIATSRYARWIEEENRRETWVETVDDTNCPPTCFLDPDAAIPGTAPPGAGVECLQSAVIVTGGKQAYAKRDLGLEITKTITSFYLNVAAAQDFTAITKNVARLKNSDDTNVIRFRLSDNAGQLQFNLNIYNDGAWQDYYYPAAGSISLNTWYEMDITYDNINDAWEWKVNGETQPDPLFKSFNSLRLITLDGFGNATEVKAINC